MRKYMLAWMNVCRFQSPYRLLASNICFFPVYDVYEMYVALRCTSVPCLEQGHPTLSDSDRNVNNARVSVRRPCVSNLKNQIFCHLRIYSFSSGRQTSTLALAIKSQLPCTCSEKMRCGIRQHYLKDRLYYICITSSSPARGPLFYNLPRGDAPHPLHLC